MKIYRITHDLSEKYDDYFMDFPNSIEGNFWCQNEPLPENWTWPALEKEGRRRRREPSFTYIWGYHQLLLVNEKAWEIVSKPLLASGQYYPISMGDKSYHLVFPWHVTPTGKYVRLPRFYEIFDLDDDSTWDKAYSMCYYVFDDPDFLSGQYPIFQTASNTRELFTISTPELREKGLDFEYLVRENNLTGLVFKKVWESNVRGS